MTKGEEWETAFRSSIGHYEYIVMPCGLTNASASFQHFINDILHEYLDLFCTAFIDDMLVYSDNIEEHRTQVRLVLEAVQKAGLYLKPEK